MKLETSIGAFLEDIAMYGHIIKSLIYMTITRLDGESIHIRSKQALGT